jgi:N-acetylmuramate 1-kinase
LTDRMEDLSRWFEKSFGPVSSIEPVLGDASAREFYRVVSRGVSYVTMDSGSVPLWPWLDIHGLLYERGFPLPEIIHTDEAKRYVIQQDLGSVRLCDVADDGEYTVYLQDALTILRRMQREILPANSQGSISSRRYFTPSFFMAELEHTLEHLFFRLLRVPVEELLETQKLFRVLCERASGDGTGVFTHRDYHSANMMIHRGSVFLLDWQDARQGPPCYDLASVLRDSYRSSGDQWKGMASSYILGVNGANMFQFVFSSLQRNLKALGTFAYQYRAMDNDRYLRYIPHTLRYLEEYGDVCPAVKRTVDNVLHLVDTHTGEIDLRDFRNSDMPVRINL